MATRILTRRLTNNLRSSPFTAMVTGKNTVILNNSAAPLAKISPQNLTNFSPFRPKLLHRNPNLFPLVTLRNFSTENHGDKKTDDEGNPRKNSDLKRDDEDLKHLNRRHMEGLIDDRHLSPLQKETLDEMIKVVKNRRSLDIRSAVHGVVGLGLSLTLIQLRPWFGELISPLMYDSVILMGIGSGVLTVFAAVTARKNYKPIMSLFKEMKHHNFGLAHLLEDFKCSNKEDALIRRHIECSLYPMCFTLVFMRVVFYILNH